MDPTGSGDHDPRVKVPFEVTSCLLYHGPGAEMTVRRVAQEFGRPLPFDGSSLKKEGAREVVGLVASLPVGSGRRSLILGPLDEVSAQVGDVLLKTLEEFNPAGLRPFLWAWDFGGVPPTIRSRCVCLFAPGTDDRVEAHLPRAEALVKAFLGRDWVGLVEEWKEGAPEGGAGPLLSAVVEVVAKKVTKGDQDPRLFALWGALRDLLGPGGTVTPAMAISAFLGAGL